MGATIKTTLFFAGQANDGTTPYSCHIDSNLGLYTRHPTDDRHLAWSESGANRVLALSQMAEADINVINMSSWGETFLPCAEGWVGGVAPMQCDPEAHNELFAAAVGQTLLIVPFIESRSNWTLRSEFPTLDGETAPGTISQVVDLIDRYLHNAEHPEWADRWARIYDRSGSERYAVTLIHVASDNLSQDQHEAFASGFDSIANAVYEASGEQVGFFLDVLPHNTNAPGVFHATASDTGPYLNNMDSVLGVQCFIPEVFTDHTTDQDLVRWKREFLRGWYETGIPTIVDVSPGYDASAVFPDSKVYGHSDAWRSGMTSIVSDYGSGGMVFNSWNGYTEGMVAVATEEDDAKWFDWLKAVSVP